MKNKILEDATLTLFFTSGISLRTWREVGNLDRELQLYKRLSDNLKRINFVTYGDKQDKIYSNMLGDINLLPAKWYKKPEFTILHLLLKYYPELKDTDILKTNQIPGSEIPLWFKKHFGKKLIVRCGYLHSYFIKNQTKDKKIINDAVQLEKNAFSSADMGVVTSAKDRDYVIREHKINPEKIKVIPNYVITDVFKPISGAQKVYDLVYVGRGSSQKNIENLLKAVSYFKTNGKEFSLLMMGNCCDNEKTKRFIEKEDLNVTLKGNIPNFELPIYLNQAKIFILPSYWEGHPKVLLEAMSCGLPCIGTNVDGIKEDIQHMDNGYLSGTDFKDIAEAIEAVLSDEQLQRSLGRNAREHIIKNYSLDKVLEIELEVIQEVLSH